MGRRLPEGHEPVEHTADIALRVWARDLTGLFRQAGAGLLDLLAGPGSVAAREQESLEIEGADLEELMVAWLNEILFRCEHGRRRFAAVESLRLDLAPGGPRLTATLTGEAHDPARHSGGAGVKAATYHALRIDPQAVAGYDLILVFDT